MMLIYITIPSVLWINIVMMALGIHCWCLSLTQLYLMYSGYTLLWWPRVYIAGAYLYHFTLCTLDTHCYDDPGYTLLVLIYNTIPYCSGYTWLWWPWVYIAGTYLYHYTLYTLDTLDTHCYDDPGYTLLVLIYITIPCVLWIHIVMIAQRIHCWCLSITLYLMYPGYTLLWWPRVYIAGAYLYHYTLCTLDTHGYDDPGYTLLVLIYNTIPYVPRIHIVMMTQGIHSWCLSISLYLVYSEYTWLWSPWIYIAGAYL